MRILVTGAGGFVGRRFMAAALAGGHQPIALPRTEDGFSNDWPTDVEDLVHLAALNPRRDDPASRDPAALRRANVDATRALARRAARAGIRRLVFVSSAAVHAPRGSEPVSEAAALSPQSPYAASKAEAEAVFWGEIEAGGVTAGIVLRPVAVFGPGARNLTGPLARLARTPLPLPLGGLGAPRSLVSVDGLAAAILRALDREAAAGGTFLVADDGPLRPAEIVAALREGAGRRPMLLPAPVALATGVARLFGKRDFVASATRGLVVDNRRAREALGWHPANAREALRAMAADGRL